MKRKTPTIYQMEATECGAASLAMILAYWGCHIPLEQLRVDIGVSRDGCNAKNIMLGGRKYGLEVHGYRKEPSSLKSLDMPCIIHWNFNHFVVLEGFKGKSVYINDPAHGRRKITWEDLDNSFSGIVLTFKKTAAFKKNRKAHTLLDFIIGRIGREKQSLAVLLFLGILLIIPGLVLPILSQLFIDKILIGRNTSMAYSLILAMICIMTLETGMRVYRGVLQEKLNQKISLLSTHSFFTHLFELPISFFDQRSLGDLVNRNENNETVNQFITGSLANALLDMITAMFYLILLFRYSLWLTVIGCIGITINIVIAKYCSSILASLSEKQQVDGGKFSGVVYAGIRISETIKAAGVENDYCARILGHQAKAATAEQKSGKLQSLASALSSVLDEVFSIAILIVGGLMVINGNMTAGMLVAYTSLFSSFSEPVQTIIGFIQSIQDLKADMGRVDDVERHKVDDSFVETPKVSFNGKLKGNIKMKGIEFGYSALVPPLVTDFDLEVQSGESIALVGTSGSGKSTIGKLLSGLYKPWKGTILFDNVPRESIPGNILQASIATVSQDVVLFSGTIRENLSMWNPNILEEDLITAAKDACIHEVITAKQGAYDYILQEGASNLSGGQRQRLEIARALSLNPSILVLDEATSALDPITEKLIVDNIKRRGCTCFVVAHRLSAIRDCDEIIVLDQGRVVQRGTHESLINVEGFYKDLVQNM